ncbi:arsinothricin resistance N-acetyltransferase ArsN1 family B [Tengunoibacter tsumagoiensis]|uniref:N-acetyltransferase n=1 Tax=Tengunoibacter tsumagoiensis TaxID=2014871 RepID=A0A402A7I0_9CHLR|nr:arsinothricin resistance N-acetyltransferase ArsN1 family B [Tengunoibacter tsumagoiensis]GCE14981.1 N-acetyltransferase [Tengunoibacter tsumagoiensis]
MQTLFRLARASDADAISAIYTPIVERTATSFELKAPGPEEIQERIIKTLLTHPWLVAEKEGDLLGYAYASQHRSRLGYQWSADISVYIAEQNRGQGLGRALYTSLFALLRLQGFYNVYAGISLPNPGSVALHEAMGMIPVGIYQKVGYKNGAWQDVGWWQGNLQDYQENPLPPLSLAEAQLLAGWQTALTSGQ